MKSIAIVEQLHNKRMLRRPTERYATITLLLGSDSQLYNAGEFGFTAVDNEHEIESAQYLSKVNFLPHVESIDSSALSVAPSTRLVLDSAQAPEPGRFTGSFRCAVFVNYGKDIPHYAGKEKLEETPLIGELTRLFGGRVEQYGHPF